MLALLVGSLSLVSCGKSVGTALVFWLDLPAWLVASVTNSMCPLIVFLQHVDDAGCRAREHAAGVSQARCTLAKDTN
jgi:hypothetical protein